LALQLLRDQVALPNLETALRNKYERHNRRAALVRLPLMAAYPTSTAANAANTLQSSVGRAAASTVTLQSLLRAATVEEKEQLRQQQQQRQRQRQQVKDDSPSPSPPRVGLHVREEIYDGILALLKELQQPTPRRLDVVAASALRMMPLEENKNHSNSNKLICPLTLLSMARRCVELGALAVVPSNE